MPESLGEFFLGSEFTLSEHNGDETKVGLIIEGQAVDGFMANEDNAVAIAIDKPKVRIDEAGGEWCGIQGEGQFRGVGAHENLDVEAGETVPRTAHVFRNDLGDRNPKKHEEKWPMSGVLNLVNRAANATKPNLAEGGGQLYLTWYQDLGGTSDSPTDAALYVQKWNGISFAEQIPGDASFDGIQYLLVPVEQLATAVDPAGHPFVAWQDESSGHPAIYFRGNLFDLRKVYYVNDGSMEDAVFTTAPGSDANTGLKLDSPKASIAQVLDSYILYPGDVILVDSGIYDDPVTVPAEDQGILILGVPGYLSMFTEGSADQIDDGVGSPDSAATLTSWLSLDDTSGVTIQGLVLEYGVSATDATNPTLIGNEIDDYDYDGLTLWGGSGPRLHTTSSTSSPTSTGILSIKMA